MTNWPMGKR